MHSGQPRWGRLWRGFLTALLGQYVRLVDLLAAPSLVVPAPSGLETLVDLEKIRAEPVNGVEGKKIARNEKECCSE